MQLLALFFIPKTLHKESAMCTHCSSQNLPLLSLVADANMYSLPRSRMWPHQELCATSRRHLACWGQCRWMNAWSERWMYTCVPVCIFTLPSKHLSSRREGPHLGECRVFLYISTLQPMGQIWPIASFINKVLIEHCHVHWFRHCLCLFSCYSSRIVVTKTKWPTELKTFSIWLFTENVWQSVLENKGSRAPKSCFLNKIPSWQVAISHGNTVTKNNDIVIRGKRERDFNWI